MLTYQDVSGSNGPLPSPTGTITAEALSAGLDPLSELEGGPFESEEVLIIDHRAGMGPAQQVEHKLSTLLGGAVLPVSHVRMSARLGSRNHC